MRYPRCGHGQGDFEPGEKCLEPRVFFLVQFGMFRHGDAEPESDFRALQHSSDPSGFGESNDEIVAKPAFRNPAGMPLKAASGNRDQVTWSGQTVDRELQILPAQAAQDRLAGKAAERKQQQHTAQQQRRPGVEQDCGGQDQPDECQRQKKT